MSTPNGLEEVTPATPAALAAQGLGECWTILREHGKTFHLMARLLGPTRGDAIAALYGFARVADDLVDERDPQADIEGVREQLHAMLDELELAAEGRSRAPRFVVLGETVRRYGIPLQPFRELVAGVAMDLDKRRYATFTELTRYCYRVAGTVGLMITPVAGYRAGTAALEHAKTLGTAMQLTNILRDVGEDHARGIVYLPEDELAEFGLTADELPRRWHERAFRELMEFQIARARRLYDDGLALIPLLTSHRGRAAFQFACDAYAGILDKIRDNGYDVFSRRASLSFSRKLRMIPACTWRAFHPAAPAAGHA